MSDARAHLPRYPIYIPSKGRADHSLTARFLREDGVPFRVVVEPPEAEAYARAVGEENVLVLPFHDLGRGSIPARNWIWDHALSEGHERHWTLDDNIYRITRYFRGRKIRYRAGPALWSVEEFADRFTNVGICGMNYRTFAIEKQPAVRWNVHVYSCMLIRNDLPQRWRGRYNEDTDLCLQVLSAGLCTFLTNVFLIDKVATMTVKGGNTDELYAGDGRLRMARDLERQWPGTVSVTRRWQRPQHHIKDTWRKFDTVPIPVEGFDPSKLPRVDELGVTLQKQGEVTSKRLLNLFDNPD